VIVTRRRRKPFPWRRFILPVIAIGLIVVAIAWPPSRGVLTGGPLSPMWQTMGARFNTVAAPFHFAALLQRLTEANQQIVQLQTQVADLQSKGAAKDKQISALNTQVSQLQTQAANANSTTAAAPVTAATASPGVGTPALASTSAGDLTADATANMRRTAQVWANMDPEDAAKVIQRLPVPYVARVLALMSPDDAGAILDAVTPTFAAQLTQENPSIKR